MDPAPSGPSAPDRVARALEPIAQALTEIGAMSRSEPHERTLVAVEKLSLAFEQVAFALQMSQREVQQAFVAAWENVHGKVVFESSAMAPAADHKIAPIEEPAASITSSDADRAAVLAAVETAADDDSDDEIVDGAEFARWTAFYNNWREECGGLVSLATTQPSRVPFLSTEALVMEDMNQEYARKHAQWRAEQARGGQPLPADPRTGHD